MTRTVLGAMLVLAHAATPFARAEMPGPSYTVLLELCLESDVTRRTMELMRTEIERIWRPYGVAIEWEASALGGPDRQLHVTIGDAELDVRAQSSGQLPLAWILFTTPTRPLSEIRVSVNAARFLVAAVRIGWKPITSWPGRMREELLGRALGRSVAHELGHYLLASRRHTETGLMRAVFRPNDLLRFRSQDYVLAPRDARVLADTLGARR